MPQFHKDDRVVYKADPNYGHFNRKFDGETGTVTDDRTDHLGRVFVRWDDALMEGVRPYATNLQPHPATVTPITTAYEADTHHDDIAHPSHYAAGRKHEPKDVIRDWGLGFNLGAVVKYVARAGRKADTPTLKDLRKARQFLDFEIEALEAEAGK